MSAPHKCNVTQELACGREGGMAEALEVGNQGRQAWPDQATFGDVFGQGCFVGLFTSAAPVFGTGVLLDGQLGRLDIDLLDDQGQSAVEAELSTTTGTAGKGMFKEMVDLLVRAQGAVMLGVAGLRAALTVGLSGRLVRHG